MNQPSVAKIDFKKYRTEELYSSVVGLINIRGLFFNSIYYVGVVAFVVALVCGALFWARGSLLSWALIESYCGLFGFVMGVLFAIAQTIRLSLDNMLKLVDFMMGVTRQVAEDTSNVATGDTRLPTSTELVQGVYYDVFTPIIERAIKEQFWILSRPILFVYKMTFARIVRLVIGKMPPESVELNDAGQAIQQKAVALSSTVVEKESAIISTLSWTENAISGIGGWLKMLVMMPCYVFCIVIGLLAMIPLVVAWYLTGKTPEPEEAEAAIQISQKFLAVWPIYLS
jgi:hypothetical protein